MNRKSLCLTLVSGALSSSFLIACAPESPMNGDVVEQDSGSIATPMADGGPADVPNPPVVRDSGTIIRDTGVLPPPPPPPPAGNPLEAEILVLTNQARARGANCGGRQYPPVPALTANAQLRQAAYLHSLDMATNRFFDHVNPRGQTPFVRIRAAGYNFSTAGENIAAGNGTAAATMTQWMNSPGHCTNIMNGGYRELGVGYAANPNSQYRHYWTQNFGTR